MTAPRVSAARWKPKTLPKDSAGTPSASRASRGAPRMPLPIRSTTRPSSTTGQTPAAAMITFPKAASP